jgi:hypothetical protein
MVFVPQSPRHFIICSDVPRYVFRLEKISRFASSKRCSGVVLRMKREPRVLSIGQQAWAAPDSIVVRQARKKLCSFRHVTGCHHSPGGRREILVDTLLPENIAR